MTKFATILACLLLLGCGSTPKPSNQSDYSDGVITTNDKSEKKPNLPNAKFATSNLIQHDIGGMRLTYTPPHVKGDQNFRGECDLYATATLKISNDKTKLFIELYFEAKEPHPDNSEVSGKETFLVYDTKDTSNKIMTILTGRMDRGQFTYGEDKGLHLIFEPYTIYAEWDMINGIPGGGGKALRLKQKGLVTFAKDFTKNGLVKKWVFDGNLNSDFDDASHPRLIIETHTISILLSAE